MNLLGIERQQRPCILQQHNAFRRTLTRNRPLLRSIHFAAARVRVVKQPAHKDHAQNAAHIRVERGFTDVPSLHLGQHLVRRQRARAVA